MHTFCFTPSTCFLSEPDICEELSGSIFLQFKETLLDIGQKALLIFSQSSLKRFKGKSQSLKEIKLSADVYAKSFERFLDGGIVFL